MADFAGLDPATFWIAFAALTLGAAVQRLSGQGFGLISAPMVAIVAPEMVPAALLLLGFLSGLGASALDLSAINIRELSFGFAGRTLGAVIAAYMVTLLPGGAAIAIAVACLVLLAVALSLLGISVPIRRATLFGAGLVAGIMGTLTAIGAPPMALLYQNEPPRRSRAMQSTFFFLGMIVSIAALAIAGLISRAHVAFALAAAPAILLGLILSQPLSRHIPTEAVRPMALALSSAAACLLLIKVLVLA